MDFTDSDPTAYVITVTFYPHEPANMSIRRYVVDADRVYAAVEKIQEALLNSHNAQFPALASMTGKRMTCDSHDGDINIFCSPAYKFNI